MRKTKRHVKHHHVFIMVFSVVAIFFAGNVLAINTIHQQITSATLAEGTTPIILARNQQYKSGEKVQSNPDSILLPLADVIQNVTKKYNVDFAVSVQNLQTGDYVGVNDELVFKAASFYKLFVALEVLREVDSGNIQLNQSVGNQTVQTCIEKIITKSDNQCGRNLRSLIRSDTETLQAFYDMGYIDTTIHGEYPLTSARDIAKFYDDLYNQRHLKSSTNQFLIDVLASQENNDRIPLAVPADMKIAHKTGDLEGFSHDAGILYTDYGDYSITILSGKWPNGYLDAPEAIIQVTRNIYNWLPLNS